MDAIDRKILAVLQENAALSVAEIGSRVGLSSTPCWKRIQRLEADGVIQKRVALVDQDRVGLGISVFVSIETGDHSQDWLDRFAKTVTAILSHGRRCRLHAARRRAGHRRLRRFLQTIDCRRFAQKRDVALCHGKDQVDDRFADPVSGIKRGAEIALHALPVDR